MTLLDTAKVTSKGQVTIPNRVRKLLHLKEGSAVAFSVRNGGVYLLPCEIKASSPYTEEEWKKIEKLASEKPVKVYKSAYWAKKHIASL